MNKKKLIIMLSSIALIAVVGVGATLAYFTDSTETMPNIITTGNVNITISENKVELAEDGVEYERTDEVVYVGADGLSFVNVLPGQPLPKNPTISLQGSSRDAYVRATVTVVPDVEIAEPTEEDVAFLANLAELQAKLIDSIDDTDDWVFGEGDKLYFQDILTKDNAAKLFDEVVIPTTWTNNSSGRTFKILIQAEAVQSDYLEISVLDPKAEINSWTGITPEEAN